MISPRSIASVFRFETRKAATLSRMAWWLALAFFPVVLTFLLQWADDGRKAEIAESRARIEEQGKKVTSRTEEISVVRFSTGGVPTIDVDGNQISGMTALKYVSDLGDSDIQRQLKEMTGRLFQQVGGDVKKRLTGDANQEEPSRPRRRNRQRNQERKSDLIVNYPATIPKDDPGLIASRAIFKDSFARVIYMQEGAPKPPSMQSLVWGAGLFILLPSVVAMLSTFLWAAPSIGSELEGRSWAYIATRPNGPVSVLLGKYLVGVTWGISAAMTGLIISLMIAEVPEGYMHLFKPLAILILIACPAYGAIFTLIGAIAPRRAMVVSVAYVILLECMVSILPVLGFTALISRVTVQYPMRSIMARWLQLDKVPEDVTELTKLAAPDSPMIFDFLSIFLITAGALAAAVYALRVQELTAAHESDS